MFVTAAVVVVQVDVTQADVRLLEPLVEAAADVGVAHIQDETQTAEVEVARVREVRPPCARHVLDRDDDARLVLPGVERLEGALETLRDGGVARRDVGVPVGVHHVQVGADLGGRLQMATVLLEGLPSNPVVGIPDAGVAERTVHRVSQAGALRGDAVPLVEQTVASERADLRRRRQCGDGRERGGQRLIPVGAGGDRDVGEVVQRCQYARVSGRARPAPPVACDCAAPGTSVAA